MYSRFRIIFNRDIYDIRKFEEVLQESYMMIPDSKRRLEASIENLRGVLVSLFTNSSRCGIRRLVL